MASFDVAVIGGGVIGLNTTWFLTHTAGARVLLIDQLPFPTTRNSSSGHSRIYRTAYSQPEFARLMRVALPLWRELEEQSGMQLLHQCGLLYGGASNVADRVEHSLRSSNLPSKRLTARQVHTEWPQLQAFPSDHEFVFDESAGVLAADLALQSLHKVLRDHPGCTLRFREKVVAVQPSEKSVRVVTGEGSYEARTVVITAGPWAPDLLGSLNCFPPLETQTVAIAYFKIKGDEDSDTHKPAHLPTVVYETQGDIYVLPEFEYPGFVKIGNHTGLAQHPDSRDRISDAELVQPLANFVQKHMPKLDPRPAIVEHCMYTRSPDDYYVLDRHPQYHNVVIGTGFSGHAFKLAPAVGQILGRLALGRESNFDLDKFKITRFGSKAKL